MTTTKMYLKQLLLTFVLLIQGNQSMDTTTQKQILDKISALEKKDFEMSDFNTRLLAMIENLKEQMKQKDVTINRLQEQVNMLEQKETDNKYLLTEVRNLNERISVLEAQAISEEEQKVQSSKASHHNNPESNEGADQGVQLLTDIYGKDKRHLQTTKHEKAIHKIRQTSSAPDLVAFHATNNHGEITHVGVNQNIVFESVLLNLASAYHKLHGIFIAPTSGLYLFSTSIMAYIDGKAVYAVLVKNGNVLARVQAGQGSGYDQGSVTVVTQLNASDEVWVRLYCCADDTLYGGQYTSFTGVMLTAM